MVPIIYRVSCRSGGAEFLPSTVAPKNRVSQAPLFRGGVFREGIPCKEMRGNDSI